MSLTLATLLPGLLLIALGVLFLVNNSAIQSTLKALPRSQAGAIIFFGGGALWFLYNVWNVSAADLVIFTSPQPWVLIFGALSALALPPLSLCFEPDQSYNVTKGRSLLQRYRRVRESRP